MHDRPPFLGFGATVVLQISEPDIAFEIDRVIAYVALPEHGQNFRPDRLVRYFLEDSAAPGLGRKAIPGRFIAGPRSTNCQPYFVLSRLPKEAKMRRSAYTFKRLYVNGLNPKQSGQIH